MADVDIAYMLFRGGYITSQQYEVWKRSRDGETIYSMRGQYRRPLDGKPYGARTLYDWVHKVHAAIRDARDAEPPDADEYDRTEYRIPIAEGHDLREVSNSTQRRGVTTADNPLVSSFPDAESLRASGKRARF